MALAAQRYQRPELIRHCAQEDYQAAIEIARRWLALDRLNEEAHCQLMRIYLFAPFALSGIMVKVP